MASNGVEFSPKHPSSQLPRPALAATSQHFNVHKETDPKNNPLTCQGKFPTVGKLGFSVKASNTAREYEKDPITIEQIAASINDAASKGFVVCTVELENKIITNNTLTLLLNSGYHYEENKELDSITIRWKKQ